MFDLIIQIRKLPSSWYFPNQDHGIFIRKYKNKIKYKSLGQLSPFDRCRSDQINEWFVCVCKCRLYTHALHKDMHAPSPIPCDSQHLTHINVKHHCCATPGLLCNIRPLEKRDYVFESEGQVQVQVQEEEGLLHQSWEREMGVGRGDK